MELIQAVCLTPACDFLEQRVANVEKHLEKSGLNAFSPRNPQSWLPKELVFRFIEQVDKREPARENTSFSELVDQRAAREALSALNEPLISIKEAPEVLGYSDPAHFIRAFRRWTGQSPKSYRDTGF